jgi:hypothetical protein
MDNKLLEVIFRAPDISTRSRDTSLRLIYDGNRILAGIMTDRGVTYPKKPSWLISRAFYEFIFKMEYYAGHGMPSSAARIDRLLGPFSLERMFLGKNKYYHLRQWFRDELASFVKDILYDRRSLSRDYLDPSEVRKVVTMHTSGNANGTHIIDKLLTLELVQRIMIAGY